MIDGYSPETKMFVKIITNIKQTKNIQKTGLIQIEKNPFFNQTFLFPMHLNEYLEANIEYSVCLSLGSFDTKIFAYAKLSPLSTGLTRKPFLDAFKNLGAWMLTKISLDSAIYRQI